MKDTYLKIFHPGDFGVGPEPTLHLVECTDEEYADFMDSVSPGNTVFLIPVDDVRKVLNGDPQPLIRR